MDKIILGVLFALAVGVFCRWVNIPAPAPPNLIGALMVLSVSAGYFFTDYLIARNARLQSERPNTTRHLCGGPTGAPAPTSGTTNPAVTTIVQTETPVPKPDANPLSTL